MAAKKKSLRDIAYEQLKERIIDCTYAPDSMINEEWLQSEFGVSRTPIREALIMLEREGLVKIMPKKGVRIVRMTLEDVHDVFEIRKLIEPYILRQYGHTISRQRLNTMLRKHRELLEALEHGPEEDFKKQVNALDCELHGMLIDSAHNPYFFDLRQTIFAQNSRLRVLSAEEVKGRLIKTVQEHLELLQALRDGDMDSAQERMVIHLIESEKAAVATITANPGQMGNEPAADAAKPV